MLFHTALPTKHKKKEIILILSFEWFLLFFYTSIKIVSIIIWV